jgi:protein-disulfide isomerase
MSRKTQRNRASPEREAPRADGAPAATRISRRGIAVGSVIALLLVFVAGTLLYKREGTQSSQPATTANRAALASEHSPTLGDASAKVHVVEFLDPACETCALFFPMVKQLMAQNPGKIRLSTRHVPFHQGSEYVVRMLEASRKQDKYWQTLEALLASQSHWAPHHTVQPELALQAIAGVGLNVEQLMADMNAPEVSQRMEQDLNDAVALKVTATPEYFINGRPLPSFGEQQLLDLVKEELQNAY